MTVNRARKKRRLFHRFLVLLLTPVLIATNLLGTLPDNRFSAQMRQYLTLLFPLPFTNGLNQELAAFSLPTLPSAPGPDIALHASPTMQVMLPTFTATPTLTLTPSPTPTVTLTPTPTFTPTITATPTLVPNPAGTWLFSWQYSTKFNTVWQDSFRIVQRGDRFLVTFVSNTYLGDLTIISQSWDGNSLDFTYHNWAIPTNVHLKTIGIDSEGKLWVQVLSPWMGPPITSLPPVQ